MEMAGLSGPCSLLPLPPARQTPAGHTCSFLYRIYEFFVLGWIIAFRDELEYFCGTHPDWAVAALPDPADSDPLRYAILAVLTHLLCDSFNRRIAMGLPRDAPAIVEDFEELQALPKVYERAPEWVNGVSKLLEPVVIPDVDGNNPVEGESDISPEFKAMNIIVQMPHIHFT